MNEPRWTLDEGLELIRKLVDPLKNVGYSIGVTGSVLIRGSSNDDIDLLVYPLSTSIQNEELAVQTLIDFGFILKYDVEQVHTAWRKMGSTDEKHVRLFRYDGRRVDVFFVR